MGGVFGKDGVFGRFGFFFDFFLYLFSCSISSFFFFSFLSFSLSLSLSLFSLIVLGGGYMYLRGQLVTNSMDVPFRFVENPLAFIGLLFVFVFVFVFVFSPFSHPH